MFNSLLCAHFCFFFSSRRRHTRFDCDWSSDVCSSDLARVSASNQRFAFLLMPFLLFRLVPYPLKGITSPSQTYLGTPCWPVSSSLLSLRFLAGRLQVPGKLDALLSIACFACRSALSAGRGASLSKACCSRAKSRSSNNASPIPSCFVVSRRRDLNRNETLRSEEHTSELQSQSNLVCRLLLEKKKNRTHYKGRHRARWHVDSRKLHTRDSLQERRTIGLRMQAVNLALADALTVLGMNTLTIAS